LVAVKRIFSNCWRIALARYAPSLAGQNLTRWGALHNRGALRWLAVRPRWLVKT
jgi:hypothetical protein